MSEELPRYHVCYTAQAAEQIREIFVYIDASSPQNAVAVVDRIITTIDGLDTLPYGYGRARIKGQAEDNQLRRVIVDGYVILYQIDEQKRLVLVLDVRHGARRPES